MSAAELHFTRFGIADGNLHKFPSVQGKDGMVIIRALAKAQIEFPHKYGIDVRIIINLRFSSGPRISLVNTRVL